MVARFIPFLLAFAMSAMPVIADDDPLPPVDWGEPPVDVIEQPYLCRGPMSVDEGIEVHMCSLTVLGRKALVGLYFVDGSYACYVVKMEAEGAGTEQVRREFDALVSDLEAEVGPVSDHTRTPDEEPVATWLTEHETIKVTMESVGTSTLLGIVALADEHEQRIARLVSW